jgi:histidinol-phosphate phosphatase family protein
MSCNNVRNRAVFIDRDGTINHDTGFISHPEGLEVYPFASKAIKLLNDLGFYIFVVTNQSGIARGLYTFDDLEKIHAEMNQQLLVEGAKVNQIYISPYFASGSVEPYNIEHKDRKPGIGLYQKAKKAFEFCTKDSFMIGDRYTDIVFGTKAGLRTIFVLTGEGEKQFTQDRTAWEYKPDFIVKNLLSAAKLIESLVK